MAAWLLLGLLGAAGEQVIDPLDSAEAWQLNADGGGPLTFGAADGTLRLEFPRTGPNAWANLRRAITVPDRAVALRLRVRVLAAEPGAAMYCWFMEADGDGYNHELTAGGRRLSEAPRDAWLDLRVPLGTLNYETRGNGQRQFLTVDRMLLGCNYEPITAEVSALGWELADTREPQPLPTSEPWAPVDGPRGRIAILDEPALPAGPGAADPAALAAGLAPLGYGVTRARAGDLAATERLRRETFDLLILPAAESFPAAARDGLLAYLKAGGAMLCLGGYALDRPLAWFGDGWGELAGERQARQMDQPVAEAQLNTRRGKPGDTMTLQPEQIGLFDPSDRFDRVAYAEIGGRRFDGPVEGWVGRSLAGLNSPVFPDQHGETEPLGETYDALGRPRGPLGVVAHFFAGPFAGAAWAGVGVTNRDLAGEGLLPLADVVAKLVDGVYLHSFAATPATLHDGEPAQVTVEVTNRGRRANTVQVALLADDQPVGEARTVRLEPGESATVSESYAVRDGRDFVRFTARLGVDGAERMTRETAVCVWRPAIIAAGPRVAWRGNYVEIDGRPTFLAGTNQTGVMWHSPRENPLTWERDFQGMADRGMTVWRILHFSPFVRRPGDPTPSDDPLLLANEPPLETIRKTDAIVQLAQKHRCVLMICAHDWIPVEITDEQLEAQRVWNRFWADRYRDVPGILWDLQNEPAVYMNPQPVPAHIPPLWRRFLAETRGAAAPDAPEPRRLDGEWDNPLAVDYERFRQWLLERWIRVNVEGLREGDADAIVTVGYLQMRYTADKILGFRGLDFSNMHSYESTRALPASLRLSDRRAVSGGVSLGEFGSLNSHNARVIGADGVAAELDRARFLSTMATVFGGGGAFASNWCWRDLPDVIFPWGLLSSERLDRPWAAEYLAAVLFTRGVEPVYQPPAVYLMLPDEHRLGPLYDRIDQALVRATDTLLGLDVPFAILGEDDPIPAEARLIAYPIPHVPRDETVAKLRDWVAAGGRLYVSGEIGFAADRRTPRPDRYVALGLPPREPRPPFAGGSAELVEATVGAGRVWFVEDAPEVTGGDRLPATYRAVIERAGLERLAAEPDVPEVLVSRVADRRGGESLVVQSFGEPRQVTVGELRLSVGRDRAAMITLDAARQPTAVLSDGLVELRGQALVSGPPALVRALDGRPLATSQRLVIVPLGAGELRLAREAPLPTTAGEVRDGRWRALATPPVSFADGSMRLTLTADTDGLTLLAAADGDRETAAAALVAELRCVW